MRSHSAARVPSGTPLLSCLALLGLLLACHISTVRAECERTPWEGNLDADMAPYRGSGITLQHLAKAESLVSAGVRIRILNNTLWWTPVAKTDEQFRAANESIHKHHPILLLLTKALCAHSIPDVDFVLELGDRTASTTPFEAVPVFVGAKDVFAEQFIAYPYWNVVWPRPTLEACRTNNTTLCPRWEDRKPQLFWRGSPTGGHTTLANYRMLPRSRMVESCSKHPDLCDVGFSGFDNVGAEVKAAFEQHYGTRPKLPMDEWSKYQYMILLDGVTAPTSRSVKMAALGAVLLKQESPIREFWYSSLVPWKHYIPVSYHATDVVAKLKWAKRHPQHAKKMARELWKYADTVFTDENIACYWYRLLKEYAGLQKFVPAAPDAKWNRFIIYDENVRGFMKAHTSFPCEGP